MAFPADVDVDVDVVVVDKVLEFDINLIGRMWVKPIRI
jgi:hypothetical protein